MEAVMTGGGGSVDDARPEAAPGIDLTDPGATLVDPDLQAEIELMTELVLAAAQSTGPLTLDAIDRILGLA
jgi:hypothetical protein